MKHEDVPKVQSQEIAGMLGEATTYAMVELALVWQRVQQATTELRDDLTMDLVLALQKLDSQASTCIGHELRFVFSSFNSLSEKMRNEAVSKL